MAHAASPQTPPAEESARASAEPPTPYEWRGDGPELSVCTPELPMHFMNVLYNGGYFTHVTHFNEGRGFHQGPQGHINNVIAGERLLYLRDDETGEYASLSYAPVYRPCAWHRFTAGVNYQVIEQETLGLVCAWRLWVPEGNDPVEIWDARIVNPGLAARRVSLFSRVAMRCDGTDIAHGELYRTADYLEDLHAVFVKQDAERHERMNFPLHNGFMMCAPRPAGWNAAPGLFTGARRTLANPLAVEEGALSGARAALYEPEIALHVRMQIAPRAHAAARWVAGACSGPERIAQFRKRYLERDDWHARDLLGAEGDDEFGRMKRAREALAAAQKFELPEPALNRMFNGWAQAQIHVGATWSRWGWKGYRDLMQQSAAVAALDPQTAAANLRGGCAHQHTDGFAPRGWHPLDDQRYADSHAWLILAVCDYLKETGDFGLLESPAPFLEPEAAQATVYEHLRRALERLWLDRGGHGLCLIFAGDWNDSLTGAGRAGRGESVMLSMMFCRCAAELGALAARIGRGQDTALFAKWRAAMQAALREHAWDGQWWLCAFDDEGQPIGSEANAEGKLFLMPQAWAQLAGVADEARWQAAWQAVEERLNPNGWGLMLSSPAYTRPQPGIGRMSYMLPGHNENASVYSHGSAFAMLALLERGQADRALQCLMEMLPGNPRRPVPCQPNVFFNGFYGPDSPLKPGLGDHAWFTGSVGWFFRGVAEGLLGLRCGYDGLRVRPLMPSAWREAHCERRYRGTLYRVQILNPAGREAPLLAALTVDGQPHDPAAPLPVDGREHDVTARLAG